MTAVTGLDFGRYKRMVQDFFASEPRNDDASGTVIWCLGRQYASRSRGDADGLKTTEMDHESTPTPRLDRPVQRPDQDASKESSKRSGLDKQTGEGNLNSDREYWEWPADFLDDCESRIWMTYRSDFPPIMKSTEASMTLSVRLRSLADTQGFTSDTGWGCMIRSGQCVLANALLLLRLGRMWRRGFRQAEERTLLSLFADDPMAAFSVHRFVQHGAQACGKHPGEWFGPSATARCIQALAHAQEGINLRVYVNGDGADVYEDKLLELARSNQAHFTPTLILLGIRLGIDRVTPAYWAALRTSLEMPQSVGIAGGRPSSSHYFFAHQGDSFFYLDPHFTRPALALHSNDADYTTDEVESCHTRRLRRLPITAMDPSMLLAFLIKDEKDWHEWKEAMRAVPGKAIVHFAETEPSLGTGGSERQSALDEVETFDDDE